MAQAQPDAQAAVANFALAPGLVDNDPIDYSTSEGAKMFKNATQSLPVTFDCTPTKLKVFLSALSDRAAIFGWEAILEVPPNLAIPGVTYHLLTEYGRLTGDQVRAHVNTYNQGVTRNAQSSFAMYMCVMNSLTTEARAKVMLREDEFTVNGIRSGPNLIKTVVRQSYLDSNATTKFIRNALSNLDEYMVQVDSDIEKFNAHVNDLVDSLTARGETTQDLLSNLFKGYAAASDETFVKYMEMKESNYDEGTDYTTDQLMQLALDKFANLMQAHKWKEPSADKQKIIALEARVEQLTKQKPKKQEGGRKKEGAPAQSKNKKPEWMTKAPTSDEPQTKTVNEKLYHWCPTHQAWTRHSPSECQGKGNASKGNSDQGSTGGQELRLSHALTSIIADDEGEESE